MLSVIDRSRRRFVTGLAGAGVIAGSGLWRAPAAAATRAPQGSLCGTDFRLEIGPARVNFTGRERIATTVNGSVPAPLLRWREGDRVRLHVRNRLPVSSSIHWHGIILPYTMDGVPGLSFDGIPAGGSYTYEFDVGQAGTYWYHSHSGFQEQTGQYGPLVIEPRAGERQPADRDYVVMLSDWTDEDPEAVFRNLKVAEGYYNTGKRTVGDLLSDIADRGVGATMAERAAWGRMRMSPTDIADVTGMTYTYLMNGQVPDGNWTGTFAAGERVKLRFINGSAMSFFDVRIPGLEMTVVAADGQDVEPVTVEEFRLGVAETLDVIVRPAADRAYTLFAQAMDRSGYARGTLAPRPGMSAPVPELDPRWERTMADMGMAMHGGMAHGGGHSGHGDHNQSGASAPAVSIEHPDSEYNPGVAAHAPDPVHRLDDPGGGLRDNGRRTLTYADLAAVRPAPDPREPGREIQLHLNGNMQRYTWSFDGIPFADAEPLRLTHGERVRIVLVNDTMMEHPIHLHGLWSELENGHGAHRPFKHTISVNPGQWLSYLVSADALGRWAYHCHLLYHMEAGMFREVRVEPA